VKKICYCFDHTDEDIIADVKANRGESTIEKRIAEAKRRKLCRCEIKNPKGT
jgi:hypothetical protein